MAFFYVILDIFLRRGVCHRLPGPGVRIVPLVHIGHRQFVSRLWIMLRHLGRPVIIGLHRKSDGPALRVPQGFQAPFQDCQLVQQGIVHALCLERYLDLVSPFFPDLKFLVNLLFRPCEGQAAELFFVKPHLGIYSRHRPGLTCVRFFCILPDLLHRLPGEAGFRPICLEPEVIRVPHDKICAGLLFQIFLHAESAGKLEGKGQQHHRQRQGDHHQCGALFIPSQVGKSHPADPGPAASSLLPGRNAGFRIFYRLHGRDFRRHPARPPAGEQHCRHREQRGRREDQGRTADLCLYRLQTGPGKNHRHQTGSHQPAGDQPQRTADPAQQKGLLPDDPPKLPGRHPDGLQKAVVADIPCHGDLENVVDDQISGEDHQQEERRHGGQKAGVQLRCCLGRGIAPVYPVVQISIRSRIVSLVSQILFDLFHGPVNIQAGGQHDI